MLRAATGSRRGKAESAWAVQEAPSLMTTQSQRQLSERHRVKQLGVEWYLLPNKHLQLLLLLRPRVLVRSDACALLPRSSFAYACQGACNDSSKWRLCC